MGLYPLTPHIRKFKRPCVLEKGAGCPVGLRHRSGVRWLCVCLCVWMWRGCVCVVCVCVVGACGIVGVCSVCGVCCGCGIVGCVFCVGVCLRGCVWTVRCVAGAMCVLGGELMSRKDENESRQWAQCKASPRIFKGELLKGSNETCILGKSLQLHVEIKGYTRDIKTSGKGLPWDPVAKSPSSQCRGPELDPWSEN